MIFRRQILLLPFFPALVFAQVAELKTAPDHLQTLCTAFLNGNMDTLLLYSSPEMKQVIENGKLALGSLQISTMFGKLRFLDGKPKKATTVNGITVFVQAVRLERQELNCFLSIDQNGKLCGFYIRPQQKKKQTGTEPSPGLEEPKTGTESSFIEREVKIGKSFSLPGTLTLPRGNAPYPAVILIHGSGPNDRDETVQANKPFRDLAELLAERAAHQQIARIGDQRHHGDLQVGGLCGDHRIPGILARRRVIEQAGPKPLKGRKPRAPRGDAQRKRHRKIAQADGKSVAHSIAKRVPKAGFHAFLRMDMHM